MPWPVMTRQRGSDRRFTLSTSAASWAAGTKECSERSPDSIWTRGAGTLRPVTGHDGLYHNHSHPAREASWMALPFASAVTDGSGGFGPIQAPSRLLSRVWGDVLGVVMSRCSWHRKPPVPPVPVPVPLTTGPSGPGRAGEGYR